MGIFKKKEEESLFKGIPLERLAYYNGAIKKQESYTSKTISYMPFDLQDIERLSETKKWDYLFRLSVQYAIEKENIPSNSKHQDYERTGCAGYYSYSSIMAEAIEQANVKAEKVEFKTLDNAFDKIVLPPQYKERVIETIAQLKDSELIFETWGLGDKIKKGKGINILLSGDSGTGKTYCGEIISEYLGLEYQLCSVATLESKWVGESEKNVSQIFSSLANNPRVLILDEVDSFLTSRSTLTQEHSSKLTNQFLIELERHNGICIMTTNRPVKLDRALARRIDLVLDFPKPDMEARERIWRYHIPEKMPTKDIDFKTLATYELNGGLIKNCVLSAARKAVSSKAVHVTMEHFIQAIVEELREQKHLIEGKDYS